MHNKVKVQKLDKIKGENVEQEKNVQGNYYEHNQNFDSLTLLMSSDVCVCVKADNANSLFLSVQQ